MAWWAQASLNRQSIYVWSTLSVYFCFFFGVFWFYFWASSVSYNKVEVEVESSDLRTCLCGAKSASRVVLHPHPLLCMLEANRRQFFSRGQLRVTDRPTERTRQTETKSTSRRVLANAQLAIDLIKGNAASVLWRTQLLQLYLISLFTMSLQYYLWFTVDRFYVTWAFRYSVLFHVLCHWFYVFFCTQCRCVRCAFVITVSALCSLGHRLRW